MKFFRRLFIALPISILMWLLIVRVCFGATYYLRADGTVTAANKANATGCGAADTAMNLTQHNAATFAAGDTITLCDNGGSFTDAGMVPPTAGEAGNVITYNASGHPIVAGPSAVGTRTLSVTKNYLTFYGLEFTGERALTLSMTRVLSSTNVTFNYCVFRKCRTVVTDAYSSCAIEINASTTIVLNNCIFTDNNRTAVYIRSVSTVTMRNCIVAGNAQYYGNGIAVYNS